MTQNLLQQLKTGIRNLIMEILGLFKKPGEYIRKPLKYISKLFTPKEEEIGIPEHWKNLDGTTSEELTIPVAPVAIEPVIVFEEPVKSRFKIRTPSWFIKLKRTLAFTIFVGCCISAINLVTTFPSGLIFVIPTAVINLDYLMKTQSTVNRMSWYKYILDDVEEDN